ncbi:MAG: uracil-DNA glycosylase [Synergistaceae bacterium]|nr:uracil-DNA glycosylase [Synergistaceae bacterium]
MITDITSAWEELREKVEVCTKCPLCAERHRAVFGEGPVNAKCVIVGEAPGEKEDEQGRPFVGPAGQLLTNILEKGAGIPRSSVYVMNVVKCRPPDNRNPELIEIISCSDYLEAQLALLHPYVVVTMGNISTKTLLKTSAGITKLRGKWTTWRGIDLLPMYHPSYLLHRPGEMQPRKETWEDVKALRAKLDLLQGG